MKYNELYKKLNCIQGELKDIWKSIEDDEQIDYGQVSIIRHLCWEVHSAIGDVIDSSGLCIGANGDLVENKYELGVIN